MKQTSRSLLVVLLFAAAALSLGLYAYFGVLEHDRKESERKELSDKLLPLVSDDAGSTSARVVRVEVTAKGERTLLERDAEGRWQMIQPLRSAVDGLVVDGLLSQLQTAKFKEVVDDNPDPAALGRYGLDSPRFTISATVDLGEGRTQALTLHGGNENSFDGSIYLRRAGETAVYSAQGGVRWALEKNSYELRNKEVLPVDPKQVRAIEVRLPRPFRVEQDEEAQWRVTKPQSLVADAATLTAMLGALKNERALAFLAGEEETRTRLELEAPATDATLTLTSGQEVRLRFSKPDADQKVTLLREGLDEPVLAEVSSAVLAALDKAPSDLRDRRVLSFSQDTVARIEFRMEGGATAKVERVFTDAGAQERWQVTWPSAGSAKSFRVSSVLWGLSALRVARFGEERPKVWESYGIGKDSPMVSLFSANGQQLAQLTIGSPVDTDDSIRFLRGSSEQVVEADVTRLKDLPRSVADLLESAQADGGPPAPKAR